MTVRLLALAATIIALGGAAGPARAADPFAWAPAYASAVSRGRQTGNRFGLLALHEVSVEVDNVFASANRHALALAEQRISEVPGVRAVHGPAALLDIAFDPNGRTTARPVMARGESEVEGEAARQRVVRRADALGWYLTENGRRVRFYVDTDDWPRVARGVADALDDSGLALAPAPDQMFEARPLWPDARHRWRWWPALIAAAWVAVVLAAMGRLHPRFPRPSPTRRVARAVAAAAGAAAPFLLVPVGGIRGLGAIAGAAAVLVTLLFGTRGRRSAAERAASLESPPPRPSLFLVGLSAALVLAGVFGARHVRVATRQWDAAPLAFVSVRGDLDEPVVVRELRRLTDWLRAQPGVANAWSIADLFTGITFEGEEASRIPDEPEEVRRILVQARTDPAVRLELAGDHREALVGIRFDDDDPTADRHALMAALERYLALELRRSVAHVDDASGTAPGTRAFGRSLLAVDTHQRVVRICARSGRPLAPSQALSVERAARQAATIPTADPGRLDAEIASGVRDFVARHPFPLPSGETVRLSAAASALGEDATVDDVRVVVAAAYGSRMPDAILKTTAAALHRRMAETRRRHIAQINFREMLYGADLPTEGVLADEVRAATLEAMGPVLGLPVPADASGAFKLDATPIGGAANDRALSMVWNGALRPGILAASGVIMLALLMLGGPGAVATLLPLAFAPLAVASVPAAMLGEAIGLPALSFFGGTLAGGAVIATTLARRRRR